MRRSFQRTYIAILEGTRAGKHLNASRTILNIATVISQKSMETVIFHPISRFESLYSNDLGREFKYK